MVMKTKEFWVIIAELFKKKELKEIKEDKKWTTKTEMTVNLKNML